MRRICSCADSRSVFNCWTTPDKIPIFVFPSAEIIAGRGEARQPGSGSGRGFHFVSYARNTIWCSRRTSSSIRTAKKRRRNSRQLTCFGRTGLQVNTARFPTWGLS
jgi:hypothetical protein